MHTKDLEANGDNALSYIAQVISGSALAKYMILAVALSALGSTLASLVSGVRVTFAMGSARRSCSTCGSRAGRTTSACRGRPTSPRPNSSPQTPSRDMHNYSSPRCAENALFCML